MTLVSLPLSQPSRQQKYSWQCFWYWDRSKYSHLSMDVTVNYRNICHYTQTKCIPNSTSVRPPNWTWWFHHHQPRKDVWQKGMWHGKGKLTQEIIVKLSYFCKFHHICGYMNTRALKGTCDSEGPRNLHFISFVVKLSLKKIIRTDFVIFLIK